MSTNAISATSNSNTNLVAQLMLAMLSLQGSTTNTQNTNSIFGGIEGYPDVLGANSVLANSTLGADSIFNTGTASSTNYSGIDSLNLQSLTSASDENAMSAAFSAAVTSALNTKLPTAKE